MTKTIDFASVDDALALAGPQLDPTGQGVAVAIYRTLAGGEPASPTAIAAEADVSETVVDGLLDEWDAVFRDQGGDVVGFWGLAVAEMPHRLTIDGHQLFAWCAWDPMFLARIIGPLDVATDDPVTGETITYGLDVEGQIHDLSHPGSVVSFLRPDREWDDQVMSTFCHYVLHFTNEGIAEEWVRDHPGTFVLGLDEAIELAQRHTDRCFRLAL